MLLDRCSPRRRCCPFLHPSSRHRHRRCQARCKIGHHQCLLGCRWHQVDRSTHHSLSLRQHRSSRRRRRRCQRCFLLRLRPYLLFLNCQVGMRRSHPVHRHRHRQCLRCYRLCPRLCHTTHCSCPGKHQRCWVLRHRLCQSLVSPLFRRRRHRYRHCDRIRRRQRHTAHRNRSGSRRLRLRLRHCHRPCQHCFRSRRCLCRTTRRSSLGTRPSCRCIRRRHRQYRRC